MRLYHGNLAAHLVRYGFPSVLGMRELSVPGALDRGGPVRYAGGATGHQTAGISAPIAALGAGLNPAHIGTTGVGSCTWHFVNNKTEGATTGTLTADFGICGIIPATPDAVNRNVLHFNVVTDGTCTLAGGRVDGRARGSRAVRTQVHAPGHDHDDDDHDDDNGQTTDEHAEVRARSTTDNKLSEKV